MSPFRIPTIFPLAVSCVVLWSCDVSESKNPPANPKSISVGQTVSGSVPFTSPSHPDTVRLAFVADSGTTYFFRLGSEYAYVNVDIHSPTMTEADFTETKSASLGWGDSLIFPCTRTGTHSLLVILSGSYLLPHSLDFKVQLTATLGIATKYIIADAYESDNTKSTAKTIPSDGSVQFHTINGATEYPSDVDWIAIQSDSGKTYTVTIATSDGRTSLSLFAPDSSQLDPINPTIGTDMWAGPNTYSFAALQSAKYFVRICEAGGPSSYSLSVTSTQGLPANMVPDAYEPDNSRATAKSIPTDSTVQIRSIDATGKSVTDIDWITFSALAGTTYSIHYSKTALATPLVNLFTPDSVSLFPSTTTSCDSNYGDGNCTSTFTATQSGTFQIKVQSILALAYRIAVTSD